MKKILMMYILACMSSIAFSYDWDTIPMPDIFIWCEHTWELQDVSDDFNYTFEATSAEDIIGGKWTNFWHNAWAGPPPTIWKRNHVFVADGNLQIKTTRTEGETVTFQIDTDYDGIKESFTKPTTNMGCVHSTERVQYPVFVEARVKIMKSVLASNVWLIEPDDWQEIDICEAYGSERLADSWYTQRIHLSHHVFERSNPNGILDYQPNDGVPVDGTWYAESGRANWTEDYHRIGVYWRDPWHLEYYIDGKWVRTMDKHSYAYLTANGTLYTDTLSINIIDRYNYTSGTGLNKAMDIIINTEDQTWNAAAGRTPTNAELENEEKNTFKVDWVRALKPIGDNVSVEEFDGHEVKVSINPYEDYIGIASDINIKNIALYNMNGSLAKREVVNTPSRAFKTSELNSGMYILKVQLSDGSWSTHKVIKM